MRDEKGKGTNQPHLRPHEGVVESKAGSGNMKWTESENARRRTSVGYQDPKHVSTPSVSGSVL